MYYVPYHFAQKPFNEEMTYNESLFYAFMYAEGGCTNWELPSIDQIQSLLWLTTEDVDGKWFITNYHTENDRVAYCSISSFPGTYSTERAIEWYDCTKEEKGRVWLVRDQPELGGFETIADLDHTSEYSHTEAKSHCKKLEVDGKVEWRLPSKKELIGIVGVELDLYWHVDSLPKRYKRKLIPVRTASPEECIAKFKEVQ